jgi:tellurite resistance protein TerB
VRSIMGRGCAMSLMEKLKTEVERYQNKGFLKAAMAVCALTALADGRVSLSGRYRIDALIETMESLRIYDPHKAIAIFDDFLDDLKGDHDRAAAVLEQKIGRYARDYKSARTLLRIAYLVLTADGAISQQRMLVFNEICLSLSVDPKEIWEKMAHRDAS